MKPAELLQILHTAEKLKECMVKPATATPPGAAGKAWRSIAGVWH